MKLIIAVILLAAIGIFGLTVVFKKATPLNIEQSFFIENQLPLHADCGALTNFESFKRFGITNELALKIMGTNDFNKITWLFSAVPIKEIRIQSAFDTIYLIPTKSAPDGNLYFTAVRNISPQYVKMACVTQP